jgi:transcription antitermination factor NusG
MPWLVAITTANSENVVAARLRRFDFEVFLPMLRKHVLQQGKLSLKIVPVFPRYLIVRMHETINFMFSIFGVINCIRDEAGYPAQLSDDVVEDIRQRELSGEFDMTLTKQRALQIGDRLRFKSGVFYNKIGIYDGQFVLVNFLGTQARVRACADMELLTTVKRKRHHRSNRLHRISSAVA